MLNDYRLCARRSLSTAALIIDHSTRQHTRTSPHPVVPASPSPSFSALVAQLEQTAAFRFLHCVSALATRMGLGAHGSRSTPRADLARAQIGSSSLRTHTLQDSKGARRARHWSLTSPRPLKIATARPSPHADVDSRPIASRSLTHAARNCCNFPCQCRRARTPFPGLHLSGRLCANGDSRMFALDTPLFDAWDSAIHSANLEVCVVRLLRVLQRVPTLVRSSCRQRFSTNPGAHLASRFPQLAKFTASAPRLRDSAVGVGVAVSVDTAQHSALAPLLARLNLSQR